MCIAINTCIYYFECRFKCILCVFSSSRCLHTVSFHYIKYPSIVACTTGTFSFTLLYGFTSFCDSNTISITVTISPGSYVLHAAFFLSSVRNVTCNIYVEICIAQLQPFHVFYVVFLLLHSANA